METFIICIAVMAAGYVARAAQEIERRQKSRK